MAAIQLDVNSIDFDALYKNLLEKLPPFAVPIFLRICSNIEATG